MHMIQSSAIAWLPHLYNSHLFQYHHALPLSSSRLGLLCAILAPGGNSIPHTTQVHGASDQMVSHTGTILTPASPHQHNTVLLHIVALSRNICCDDSTGTKANTRSFALGRVGLLGLRDADLKADTL